MKAFQRFLITLIVLGLLAAYFLWPYLAIRNFAAAANKKDVETVKTWIHVEELRRSLKKFIVDTMVLAAEQAGAQVDSVLARSKIEEFLETPQGKQILDQATTPEMMAKLLSSNERNGKEAPFTWRNEQWRSPWEFRVQDVESSGFLVMKITTSGWKVTGVEFTEDDLRQIIAKKGGIPGMPRMP